jgi:hypothetical protein
VENQRFTLAVTRIGRPAILPKEFPGREGRFSGKRAGRSELSVNVDGCQVGRRESNVEQAIRSDRSIKDIQLREQVHVEGPLVMLEVVELGWERKINSQPSMIDAAMPALPQAT